MVATIRERLSFKKGIKQHLVEDRYNLNNLLGHQTRTECQIEIANRFSVLESLEASIWVKIMDKLSAEEKVWILETHRNKA